jgi:hypothetical protein
VVVAARVFIVRDEVGRIVPLVAVGLVIVWAVGPFTALLAFLFLASVCVSHGSAPG